MSRVHLDFETRCELDLPTVGLARYVSHWSHEVLLTGIAFGDDEPRVYPGFWQGLHQLGEVSIHAFNAPFEIAVCGAYGLRLPLERWHCTAVRARQLGFSGSLAEIGAQVGLPPDQAKLADGRRLIMKFCKPRRPSKGNPERYWTAGSAREDWDRFVGYCKQDVVAERALHHRLVAWAGEESEDERRLWALDREINERGLPIDSTLVNRAVSLGKTIADRQSERMVGLTGLTPRQTGKLLEWCRARGYPYDNLRAETIEEVLNGGGEDEPLPV